MTEPLFDVEPTHEPAAPGLTFTVHGVPKAKGSMRHVGHGRMVEQLAGSKPWREAVKCCWCEPAPDQVHPWKPWEINLCDEDGVVRRGDMHHGTDYQCTGHAHWQGYHIRCTTPIHNQEPLPAIGWMPEAWARQDLDGGS